MSRYKVINKIENIFTRINYPIFAMILVMIIGILTLFLEPIIGMADNGDFYRIINQNNVYHLSKDNSDVYLGYFNKDYGIYRYNNDSEKMIRSTQSVFIQISIFINKLFNKEYILDIRIMAVLFLIIHVIASYFIIKVITNRLENWKFKMIITLLFILIFCDTGYLAYYNSFFGEGVNICCFLLSIGLLMYMIEFNKFKWKFIIPFGIFSFLFFGAKQQLAPIGILIALIFIRIVIIKRKILPKILCSIIAIIFIISSGIFYKSITGDFIYSNTYHSMNRGMLLYEGEPDKVLEQFKINEQYSLLQYTNFFEDIQLADPHDQRFIKDYYEKFPVWKVVNYYTKNPSSFVKIMKVGFKNAYSIRPKVIGNYEKDAGKTFGEKSYFFALWSTFKESYLPKNIGFSIIFISIYFYISISKFLKARKKEDVRQILKEECMFYIFLVGLSQIIISVIGAGDADLSKHEFMYNMSFDLIFIYIMSLFLERKEFKYGVKKNNE